MGERRNRPVALVTDDLRLYHRLVPVFEDRGIHLLGLQPDEDVPETVQVLLDGPDADPRHVPVRDDDDATLLAVLQRLDPRQDMDSAYRNVVFGIDPGQTIGLAVVADDQALLVAEAQTPEDAVGRIAAWSTGLHAAKRMVHIGDGAPDVGHHIEDRLTQGLPDMAIRFIHEARTTPRVPVTGSRHADAAVRIALRRQ